MKKLIAVLTLFLAFSLNASAQENKKMKSEDAAQKDAVELAQAVDLKGTQQEDFARLFLMKYNTMNDVNLSDEKKKEFTRVVDAKIRATLNAEQMRKLEANPELMNRLIGSAAPEKTATLQRN